MLQRPRFKSHLHVEIIPDDGLAIFSENAEYVVTGSIYELVAPLLDGQRSVDQIAVELSGRATKSQVCDAITVLAKRNFIADSEEFCGHADAAFWTMQEVNPVEAFRKLERTTVSLQALGDIPLDRFAAVLQEHGVQVASDGDLAIVLCDDYLHGELKTLNRTALQLERPWMLVKPRSIEIWIGPVFRPNSTGCWECLAHRLRAHRPVEGYLVDANLMSERPNWVCAAPAAQHELAWRLAANRIAKWIVQPASAGIEGRIVSFNTDSYETQTHALVRRPQCRACGDPLDPLEAPAHPVNLSSDRKRLFRDGGHRTVTAEVTLDRLQHHISPITGIVRALERRSGPKSSALHAYDASYNFAIRRRDLAAAQRTVRSRTSGKGTSDLQARTSALCEAIERYSGIFQGDEPQRMGRFSELSDRAIHPNACMGFSDRQYRERAKWNSRGLPFSFVPVPFDEDAKIPWSPVWSLSQEREKLLPTAYCYFAYPFAHDQDYCVSCSNGAAAGNSIEEAVLQGLLELIERDSAALWWYNQIPRPAVDLNTMDEPYFNQVRNSLARQGREFWVLDLTSDLRIPVFVAISRRTEPGDERILFGFGAHVDARIAVLRAVTEMNQFLAWPVASAPLASLQTSSDDSVIMQWLRTATVAEHPYLSAAPGTTLPRITPAPHQASDDLKQDIDFCRRAVEQLGLEVFVLDQTRPDIGLHVAKVIVPGLRHFWTRFAPGRLYDVPVNLGWLDKALQEDQLNPIPMFI